MDIYGILIDTFCLATVIPDCSSFSAFSFSFLFVLL